MLSSLFQLAKKDISADRARVVVGILALTVAVSFALILATLVGSLFRLTEEKVSGGANPNEIRVLPKFSVGFFRVTKEEQRKLDENVLNELRAIPGVESVRGEMVLEFPASLDVSILGTRFETDSPIYGVDDEIFNKLARNNTAPAGTLPILISRDLVDIYNLGIAQAINKPMINEEILGGFELNVMLGYSSFFRDTPIEGKKTLPGKIVGITDAIPIIGITVPKSVVAQLNKEHIGEDYIPKYTRAYVQKSNTTSYQEITQKIDSLGFDAFSVEEQVQGVQNQLSFVIVFFYILVGVVFCLIILLFYYLFFTHYRDRRYMFGLIRALGGSGGQVLLLFGIQVCMILLIGTLVGSVIALILIWVGNLVLMPIISGLITLDGALLTLTVEEYGQVVGITVLLVILAVLPPMVMATRLRPRETLLEK